MSDPLPLDPGIKPYVEILQKEEVETFESCQGGEGHACPEPMVRFHGTSSEGYRAFAVALDYGLPVLTLNRGWHNNNGELTGPYWELVFRHKADKLSDMAKKETT